MSERLSLAMRSTSGLARFVRGSTAYAVAAVAQRALGLLLLPLYTRVLDPGEYGRVAVILTISAAVSALLSLGLETAIIRSFVRLAPDPEGQHGFVNSVGLVGLVAPLALTVIILPVLGPQIAAGLDLPVDALVLALLAAAIQVSVTVVPMAVLRAQERLRDYVYLSALQSVLATCLTLLLVVILHWGIRGWFIAAFVSAVVILPVGLRVLDLRWRLAIHRTHVLGALAFGVPLIPHALAHWGLSVSDRLILGAYLPASDVGLYYVAYQFGLPLGTLAMAMHQGMTPLYAQAADSNKRLVELSDVITHQFLLTALIGFAAAALGPPIVLLVLPSEYAGAAPYIPWIALGYTFFGLYLIPMDTISLVVGKTRWIWLVTVPAAAANIVVNLVMVPRVGAIAAAIDTALGYAVLLVGTSAYLRVVAPRRPRLQWRRIAPGLSFIFVGAVLVMLVTPNYPPVGALLIGGIVVLAVPAMLIATGTWRSAHSPATSVS